MFFDIGGKGRTFRVFDADEILDAEGIVDLSA
ncbi:hypothetical protein SDC9_181525 [bioreactor metagenome]|uniref:Uncharacterized protein n=1 Tax=bioreactor metagenome TaxID=1076179 RepID=A0A645HE29_9ZZZZ